MLLRLIKYVILLPFWEASRTRFNTSGNKYLRVLLLFAFFSLLLRIWAQSRPSNFDFDSWLLVSETTINLQNPYETGRWPYGPALIPVLAVLRAFFSDVEEFRFILTLFLFLIDLAIAYLLFKKNYLLASCAFLILPTTVAISAQHQQLDNVAVLFALIAALSSRKAHASKSISKFDYLSILVLSLSLASKHIFLILPIWFALKQKKLRKFLLYLILPYGLFLLSFLPFWIWNSEAIRQHVIEYRSFDNSPFLINLRLSDTFKVGSESDLSLVFFLVILVLLGMGLRSLSYYKSVLVMGVTMVVFTPALADQYFVIANPGAISFLNLGFVIWFFLSAVYFFGNPYYFGIPGFQEIYQNFGSPLWLTAYLDLFWPLFVGWVIWMVQIFRHQKNCAAQSPPGDGAKLRLDPRSLRGVITPRMQA